MKRLKSVLFLIGTVLLSCLGMAGTENVVCKIGSAEYASFDEALKVANVMSGDVTIAISGKVEYTDVSPRLSGTPASITFEGVKNTGAEIAITRNGCAGYISGPGAEPAVAFKNLTLSKSASAFANDAGFMNVAFSVYRVKSVAYTNCTFTNGACAAGVPSSYTNCTFKKSYDKYAFWAYGSPDIVIEQCVFDDDRGIKMYAEGDAKTTVLTVKQCDFTKLTKKPAIVATLGKSVTLEGNKYSSKGMFELECNDSSDGILVMSDLTPTCDSDSGACGVLVNNAIYRTVEAATKAAYVGDKVQILYTTDAEATFRGGVEVSTAEGVTAGNVKAETAKSVKATSFEELNGALNPTTEDTAKPSNATVTGEVTFGAENTLTLTDVLVDFSAATLKGATSEGATSQSIEVCNHAMMILSKTSTTLSGMKVTGGGTVMVKFGNVAAMALVESAESTDDASVLFSGNDFSGFTGTITSDAPTKILTATSNGIAVAGTKCAVTVGDKTTYCATLADAFDAVAAGTAEAASDATVELTTLASDTLEAASRVAGYKAITIKGKRQEDGIYSKGEATFNWSKDWFSIGRSDIGTSNGNATGDGKVTFDNVSITTTNNSANSATGIHVSGAEKNSPKKANGTLVVDNKSNIVCDYIVNKHSVTVDNGSTLETVGAFNISSRPVSETGDDKTKAVLNVKNGSTVIVGALNGSPLGVEAKANDNAIGIINVEGSTFEAKAYGIEGNSTGSQFNVSGTSTIKIDNFTNGAITLKNGAKLENSVIGGANATLALDKDAKVTIDAKSTIKVGKITGAAGTTLTLELPDNATVGEYAGITANLSDFKGVLKAGDKAHLALTINASGRIELIKPVAEVNGVKYATVAEAFAATPAGTKGNVAKSKVKILADSADDVIDFASALSGWKEVTIKDAAFTLKQPTTYYLVGRDGDVNGDAMLIFDNTQMTTQENAEVNNAFGFNVAGMKPNDEKVANGSLILQNKSSLTCYNLRTQHYLKVDNSTLNVLFSLAVTGRAKDDAGLTEHATATFDIENGSTVTVTSKNGEQIGYEGIGIINLKDSTFEITKGSTDGYLHDDNDQFNVSGESKVILPEFIGAITLKDGVTLKDSLLAYKTKGADRINEAVVEGKATFSGENTIAQIVAAKDKTDTEVVIADNAKLTLPKGGKLSVAKLSGSGYLFFDAEGLTLDETESKVTTITATVADTVKVKALNTDKQAVVKNGAVYLVDPSTVAKVTYNGESTEYTSLAKALEAAAAKSNAFPVTVTLTDDIDLTGEVWTPVVWSNKPTLTLNGNQKTIRGLSDMLFSQSGTGVADITIKQLTIANANIDSSAEYVAAFIGIPNDASVTLEDCSLTDSTIKGADKVGGFVAYFASIGDDKCLIKNCTVKNCTISGGGSTGGIIGHGLGSTVAQTIIEACEVLNNTITSAEGSEDNYKAGAVMGTVASSADQPVLVSATVSSNTVTSNDTTIETIYGRHVQQKMTLTKGGSYDHRPFADADSAYISVAEDCLLEQEGNLWTVNKVVAEVGEARYTSFEKLYDALEDSSTTSGIKLTSREAAVKAAKAIAVTTCANTDKENTKHGGDAYDVATLLGGTFTYNKDSEQKLTYAYEFGISGMAYDVSKSEKPVKLTVAIKDTDNKARTLTNTQLVVTMTQDGEEIADSKQTFENQTFEVNGEQVEATVNVALPETDSANGILYSVSVTGETDDDAATVK